jgi:hypothetical protein
METIDNIPATHPAASVSCTDSPPASILARTSCGISGFGIGQDWEPNNLVGGGLGCETTGRFAVWHSEVHAGRVSGTSCQRKFWIKGRAKTPTYLIASGRIHKLSTQLCRVIFSVGEMASPVGNESRSVGVESPSVGRMILPTGYSIG